YKEYARLLRSLSFYAVERAICEKPGKNIYLKGVHRSSTKQPGLTAPHNTATTGVKIDTTRRQNINTP
ncbi:MAG: hypothetical protein KDE62_02290, partial [Calditrichaeota bacterium]|nr:hypothetical protein [Calditrichota bacterium]